MSKIDQMAEQLKKELTEARKLASWAASWPRRTRIGHNSMRVLRNAETALAANGMRDRQDCLLEASLAEVRGFILYGNHEKSRQILDHPEI